jgi:hypothetical protein
MTSWKIADFAELRVKYGATSLITSENSTEKRDEIKLQFKIMF